VQRRKGSLHGALRLTCASIACAQMTAIQKRRHQASELNARLGAVTAEVKTLRQMVRDRDIYTKVRPGAPIEL
jgi:hypothetical protein